MEKKTKKWKIILISLLILPIVVFFPACSCNETNNQPKREPLVFTVKFYTNSKDTFNIPNQSVQEGKLVRRPNNPIRSGYVFIGWYKDSQLVSLWSFELDTVTQDTTLYAKWEKLPDRS